MNEFSANYPTPNTSISKTKWNKYLSVILFIAIILSITGTYIAITKTSSPYGPDPHLVLVLILLDLFFLLAFMLTLTRSYVGQWILRRGYRVSRLQRRIVFMFILVASIPTVVVSVFSVTVFNSGLQSWFNDRVSTVLSESVAVAESYLREHKDNIRADILAMANDLNRQAYHLSNDLDFFNQVINSQTLLRLLNEAIVFREADLKILARNNLSFSLLFELDKIIDKALDKARNGEVAVLTNDKEDRVRALIKLDHFFDTYLLVGRPIDSKVLMHIQNTQGAVSEYMRLKSQVDYLQVEFYFTFLIIAMLLLLSALVLGILFARAIVKPISNLVLATEQVKTGDLSVRLLEGPEHDEIAILKRSFNMMTEKLSYQRHELIEANRQIDAKRHFSETIIAGVSAGIIALNLDRKITMINRTATNLLCVEENEILDHDFTDFCSEMEELRMQAENTPDYPAQGEIQIVRRGRKFILLVRCVAEQIDNAVRGYLITFDDVTALLAAQRSAAWADIARRIAHEIKNPLTPIRLAAERLKRKYSKEVGDEETFNKYATTIVRHVSDIGKIVEEFVQFARMPAPVFSDNNLGEMINNVIFSRQCIGTSIAYYFEDLSEPVIINCDPSQIEQVLLNLFKNAEESIELKSVLVGMINIKLYVKNKYAVISITDNGVGVPPELLDRITEPYVTNKVKGTGLGLAIVKKIIDDHGGVIQFSNLDSGGAHVKIFLPISKIP